MEEIKEEERALPPLASIVASNMYPNPYVDEQGFSRITGKHVGGPWVIPNILLTNLAGEPKNSERDGGSG